MSISFLRKTTKCKKNTNSNLFEGTGLLSQPELKRLESEKEGKHIEMIQFQRDCPTGAFDS